MSAEHYRQFMREAMPGDLAEGLTDVRVVAFVADGLEVELELKEPAALNSVSVYIGPEQARRIAAALNAAACHVEACGGCPTESHALVAALESA